MTARGLVLLALLAGACVRLVEHQPALTLRDSASDGSSDGASERRRPDAAPRDAASAERQPLDLLRPDRAARSQALSILVTGDDGEITGGQLLPSGETWWGNLIHAGSWATVTSGGPTMTYAFLRYRLTLPLPAGATIASATLELYGHALTGGSQWDPQKHKLVISADRSADAAPVTSPEGNPGGAKGAPQTKPVDWASLVWQVDAWNASPNLAPIVQELVDAHGGLMAGAHLQLWLRAPSIYPEDAEVPFEDLDHANGRAAVLRLSWLEP